ncbi:MAG: phosphate signaling complex protein PhoU [Halanaerobiaceae bacterium]
MEKVFNQKRDELYEDLSDMSEIAEEMLQNSIKALDNKDDELARQVIERDSVLDNFQITVEEKVSRLLNQEKPLVKDCTLTIAILKIASDFERIGDHATNIAEIVLEVKDEKYLQPLVMIPELSEIVHDMLDAVLDAFITENVDLAEAVCRRDEQADNIYEKVYNQTLKLINRSEKQQDVNQAVRFLTVAKSLERIGDHATNIGEETIFMVTGKRVKY